MQGELSDKKVIVTGSEAEIVGIRGKQEGRIELPLEEAALLLESGKLAIHDKEAGRVLNPLEFLKRAVDRDPKFGVRYIVYRDLKERGYIVQPGRAYFWLFPRGVKPGEKPARYFIRILSEREHISLKGLYELLNLARNMRKEPILAVVDDESDVTYYEVKEAKFDEQEGNRDGEEIGKVEATLLGDRAVLWDTDASEILHRAHFYGTLTKEKRLLLSLLETAYLMNKGLQEIELRSQKSSAKNARFTNSQPSGADHDVMEFEQFIAYASAIESEFMNKYRVYADLVAQGLILKTGFKFGSHFRVYKAQQQKHSLYLIHVLPKEHVFPLSELSRAVRLAHGVKKRMIFPFSVGEEIRYVDVGRMKL